MILSSSVIVALASQCAPNVAPETVAAIVMTESRGNEFALNVNGAPRPPAQKNAGDAAATARRYIAAGHSVDLGLGQINSRNMRSLGLTWANVFDPCTNIAALGRILSRNYQVAVPGREPQAALRVALSLYNTGSPQRGFRNGYVARVVANAGIAGGDGATTSSPVAALVATATDVRGSLVAGNTTRPDGREPPPPAWDVFERAAYLRQTINRPVSRRGTTLWAY